MQVPGAHKLLTFGHKLHRPPHRRWRVKTDLCRRSLFYRIQQTLLGMSPVKHPIDAPDAAHPPAKGFQHRRQQRITIPCRSRVSICAAITFYSKQVLILVLRIAHSYVNPAIRLTDRPHYLEAFVRKECSHRCRKLIVARLNSLNFSLCGKSFFGKVDKVL